MAVAVTAVVAAIEVTTVASVLAAVAAVGMATTVVGVVTGKPNLIKIGGELSLVGGLGGLANSAIQGMGTSALGAGVAEGATEGAFSDVAGEKFALAAGQDAAGSGFVGAGQAAGAGFSPVIAGASDMDGIIGAAQNGAQAASAAPAPVDINAASGSVTPGAPNLAGTGLGSQPNGMLELPDTGLANSATSTAATGAPATTAGTMDISDLAQTYGTDQGTLDKIKSKVGAAWTSLTPQSKLEIVKSALAIPGGIQAQRNKERELDIMDARNKQSSYGSAVPTFGIISKVQKG